MSKMFNPPHPGRIVKSALIDGAKLTITDAAAHLGVTRISLSKLLNCRSGISPEMAVRLSLALNTSIDMWLDMQKDYELWCVEKKRNQIKREVSPIKQPKVAYTKMKSKVAMNKIKKS